MMNLHLNKDDFQTLITIASQSSGIQADIIEKDYYVTLMLQELSLQQNEVRAYFKGGTCLYKIYAPMQRFSEDIDLTVYIKDLSRSQAKKMLERSSKKYSTLEIDNENVANENRKGSITQVYTYKSCFAVPEDELQRFEKVKVEATSFTISEPVEKNTIRTLLVECLPIDMKKKVTGEYDLQDFEIENISLERIFCDKLLAAEFYLERNLYFDVAKHLYDIDTMMSMPRIQNLFHDSDKFIEMLSYKRIEETLRVGSDLFDKAFADFKLFEAVVSNQKLKNAFEDMQKKYVFQDNYQKDYAETEANLINLRESLLNLDEEEQSIIHSLDFKEKVREYNVEFESQTE